MARDSAENTPSRLTPEEARAVIRAIEEVEREEAAQGQASPAADTTASTEEQ